MRMLLAVLVVFVVTSVSADDWPQFRGPNCSGVSRTNASLPVEFSDTKHVKWSVKMGDGIGSPVIAAGRVFTSAMVDEFTVGLYAFDAATGDKLWMRSWPIGDVDEIHATNSHAGTTPAADSERVYFYFSTLGMVGLDAKTGADIWQRELPVPYFIFKWGAGMSPVLHKDLVLFCQDDDLHPAFYAFDKKTGDIRWKDDRNDMAVNYSHPVICETPVVIWKSTPRVKLFWSQIIQQETSLRFLSRVMVHWEKPSPSFNMPVQVLIRYVRKDQTRIAS